MPELPEVEIIARGLEEMVRGRIITEPLVLNPGSILGEEVSFQKGVMGRRIGRVWRRGKLLILDLDQDNHLIFHLKMTGKVLVLAGDAEVDKHTHLVFLLDDGRQLIFNDQRKFGYSQILSHGGMLQWDFYHGLGPEPLSITPKRFCSLVRGRKARIKSLLLDQRVIAGVGNIYADESLFVSSIHPAARACDLTDKMLEQLHRNLVMVLKRALEQGGSSFSDYVNALGKRGSYQDSFMVYGRKGEKCSSCTTVLTTTKVAGRTSTYCPSCQIVPD